MEKATSETDGPGGQPTAALTPEDANKNVSTQQEVVKMNGTDITPHEEEEQDALSAEGRLKRLEKTFLGGPLASGGQCYSMETLLDLLIVLHDECINSSMRREKTVSDFIEYGEYKLQQ